MKETEIILRPDGSVYHLGLLPADIAEHIILVGDPERVPFIASMLDEIHIEKQNREFRTITGQRGGKRLSILSTGIGTDNIDIVLSELELLANFDLQQRQALTQRKQLKLLRIGTCGTLQASIEPGAFAFTTFSIGLDALGNAYNWAPNKEEQIMEQAFLQQFPLLCLRSLPYFIQPDLPPVPPHWQQGITFTCPGFYAAQGRNIFGKARFPDMLDQLSRFNHAKLEALNFEMETSGILLLSKLFGHRAYSLSLVMANRQTGAFYPDYEKGMRQLATEGLNWLLSV